MKAYRILYIGVLFLLLASCDKDGEYSEVVEIPNFNLQQNHAFGDSLSLYGVYSGVPNELTPSVEFHEIELNSVLFTDYSYKQRLLKIPSGTVINKLPDGTLEFPDGSILVKTFYYLNNEQDQSQGKRVIESRLLIKENGIWNVATYVWNDSQTNAYLETSGKNTQISWVNSSGTAKSINYHIPSNNECMTCHQVNSSVSQIGPKLNNLHREVQRNGVLINQLEHLQNEGLLSSFSINDVIPLVNYKNTNEDISLRGRAYLEINCAHCHNPNAWNVPAQKQYDFRYSTPFNQTGIQENKERIRSSMFEQEMPFIGTSEIDIEGYSVIHEYLESL